MKHSGIQRRHCLAIMLVGKPPLLRKIGNLASPHEITDISLTPVLTMRL